MRFASFWRNDDIEWGVVDGDRLFPAEADLRRRFSSLRQLIAADALREAFDQHRAWAAVPVADVQWAPLIPDAGKIICVGLNYEMHRKETARPEVANPTIFTRFADSQIGHGTPMIKPHVSDKLDFEGELAVVIGRGGRAISAPNALDHIAGFSCYNDGSIRDWQAHTMQFTPGKNFPNTGAFGPVLVTPDEFGDIPSKRLQTRLNGQVMQEAYFADLIFPLDRLIEYISTFTPLSPGDVIVSGTPGGVGAKRSPPVFMAQGDVIEVEIDGIGILRNPIANEI